MPRVKMELIGDKELERVLRLLPDKISYDLIMKALSKAGRIITRHIKAHTPGGGYQNRTFNMYKSIGIIEGKSRTNPTVFAGVRVGKSQRHDGWYSQFINNGTSGTGKRLLRKTKSQSKKREGLYYEKSGWRKKNGGITATHFVDRNAPVKLEAAKNSIKDSLKKIVVNYLKKNAPRIMK